MKSPEKNFKMESIYSQKIVLCLAYGLVGVALLTLFSCLQPVIDPCDPIESLGDYLILKSAISIPDPEAPEKSIPGTLYQPIFNEGNQPGAIPAMVVLPGFGAGYKLYASYSRHLASHGILALGIDYVSKPGNLLDGQHDYKARQISYAIDHLLSLTELPFLVDSSRIGILGHSMGGKLGFFAAALDDRIRLVAAMDPVNSGGAPCFIAPNWCDAYPVAPNPERNQTGVLGNVKAASLIFRSKPDPTTNPDAEFNAKLFYFGSDGNGENAVPAPALYVDMGAVPHSSYLPGIISITPRFVRRTVLAWIKQHFFGEEMGPYLTGSIMDQAIEDGYAKAVDARD
jgi:pimeloyl-ACP methyl ester carboxylesterase